LTAAALAKTDFKGSIDLGFNFSLQIGFKTDLDILGSSRFNSFEMDFTDLDKTTENRSMDFERGSSLFTELKRCIG
jgi:hypothetical protein